VSAGPVVYSSGRSRVGPGRVGPCPDLFGVIAAGGSRHSEIVEVRGSRDSCFAVVFYFDRILPAGA